jgi:hypothetical protein
MLYTVFPHVRVVSNCSRCFTAWLLLPNSVVLCQSEESRPVYRPLRPISSDNQPTITIRRHAYIQSRFRVNNVLRSHSHRNGIAQIAWRLRIGDVLFCTTSASAPPAKDACFFAVLYCAVPTTCWVEWAALLPAYTLPDIFRTTEPLFSNADALGQPLTRLRSWLRWFSIRASGRSYRHMQGTNEAHAFQPGGLSTHFPRPHLDHCGQ